jgi:hypothetical protein
MFCIRFIIFNHAKDLHPGCDYSKYIGVESQKRHNTPSGCIHRIIIQTAIQHGSNRCTRFRPVHTR